MSPPDTVVVGLGTPYLTDDAIGLIAARRLACHLPPTQVAVRECSWGGLTLMDTLQGFQRAIVIDAIADDAAPPGTIRELPVDEAIPTVRATGYHDLNLRDALAFGRALGVVLPREIVFFAVEAEDTTTFGETPTAAVGAALGDVERCVLERLARWGVLED